MRLLEGVGQEEAQDKATKNGERTHEREEPEPARLASDAAHVKNSVGQEFGRGLAELVAEVEDHDTLGCLCAGIPGREGPQTTGDEAGLCDTEQQAGGNERAVVRLEGLEAADDTEEKELEREPFARTDTVQDHVAGNLEEHNAEGQHLLADVELVLRDADVFHEVVRDGVGHVAAVKLCFG